MIEYLLEIPLNKRVTGLKDLFIVKPVADLYFDDPDIEFMAWGDPIAGNDFIERLKKNVSPDFTVNNLYGHYYFVYLNKNSGELITGNSLFSILPVYYHFSSEKLTISENAITLGKYVRSDVFDRRFVIETILFNYPLFNNSLFEDVSLLPSNSCIKISGGKVSLQKHTEIASIFGKDPVPRKKAVRTLPDKFLETVEKYLPSAHYASTLTGGFDSRTLVSAGLYYNRDFSTYSFGTETCKDIIIAEVLSAAADINFNKILLEDEYVKQASLGCGKDFISNSSGTATFARAHYLYSAEKLAADYRYIITGNFGSEIFRAMHNTGAVISENLFNLFNSDSPEKAIRWIEKSEEFHSIATGSLKKEWQSLKEDIQKLPNFSHEYSGLSRNRKFYVFVFEELFRKYFGAEMVNQFRHLKNRTPYLDIDFLKAVFNTELAGIHSLFFENNPVKRYRGQVLYAHIIRKAFPLFGRIMTDKGYRPDDLISFFGKANIVKGYIKKISGKKASDADPNSVSRAWETNRDYWRQLPVSGEFFPPDKILAVQNRDILFKIYSLSYLMNS